jgi:hypothetical protein
MPGPLAEHVRREKAKKEAGDEPVPEGGGWARPKTCRTDQIGRLSSRAPLAVAGVAPDGAAGLYQATATTKCTPAPTCGSSRHRRRWTPRSAAFLGPVHNVSAAVDQELLEAY